ncbi:Predicted thioesterase [[Clostridium] aminophilum]|uniref:Predicted thioesterase n=2 Tax=[Clostridium] aminophilum TaxID=1526 RepID=A0A1I0IB43_9FIRM|nr:thioesterase family protein [[Clostridium] aminophilum]SET94003.1 Predicted thioesterase [[Clostridium] aminophilum]
MIETGIKGRQETIVTEENSAKAVGSGTLLVFATPAMIALIEETAWKSVASSLGEGEGTVGTKLDVAHISATPVGMKVWCETELTEVDRRRLVFTVAVYDEKGKIGEGTHERFIISNEKFMEKANAKKA